MQEIGVTDVYVAIEEAFRVNDLERVEALLWPALDQFPNESRFWFYGGCVFFKKGMNAVSASLFHRAVDLDDSPHIYSNLGACYRKMNLHDEGLHILKSALERKPDYAPTLVNIGSMFVNEGCPEKGIPYLEKAMRIGGERGAIWNCGLLYLEAARFGEGFDLYRQGVSHERAVRAYGLKDGPEPEIMTPELFAENRGKGKQLILWGEQGIGDELMFGTCIPELRKDFNVIFECHPRLERLHRNAHPGLKIYPTRKDEYIFWPVTDKVQADFKMAIGDLGCYYRRDLESFKQAWSGGLYHANPSEAMQYRSRLEALAGDRPIVGLATRGGVMQTSRTYRTIRYQEIDRLMTETNALFVSLDYDDMLDIAAYVAEKHGENRYRWFPSVTQAWDYEHTAAMIEACDLTVTVCQSAAHLSAGLGCPTRVLTPIRCAWRYAPTEGDLWFWYPDPDIRLYRQDDQESWEHPLNRVIEDINSLARLEEAA